MKKLGTTSLLFTLLLVLPVGAAQALQFSDTWFFGDSLTDSGAFKGNPDAALDGKFTTSPAAVWSELLADFFHRQALANNPGNPANTFDDGTNFAQGGAQISNPVGIGQTPSPQGALPIHDQVNLYLGSHERADRNALYTLWGGANDVFFNMFQVGAGLPLDSAFLNVSTSASDLLGDVQRLADVGARYIMLPNLPDIGATPAMLLNVVATAASGNPAGNDALVAAATVLALGGSDSAAVRANALAAAEAVLGLPSDTLMPLYLQNVALGTGLSQTFNSGLLAGANSSSANIISLDVFSLLREATATPGEFGLLNVTGTACSTSSSLSCTPDTLVDPRAPGLFLYADGVHPTAAAHRIVADYAISVITAPALIANLPEALLGQLRSNQQALQTQLAMGFGEGWSFFANGGLGSQDLQTSQAWDAGSDDAGLMVGLAWRMDQNWVFGGALEGAYSDVDFAHRRGDFEASSVLLSAFADYRRDSYFASAIASIGLNADLNDVQRVFDLGSGVRKEKGDSSADMYAVKALAGVSILQTGNLHAGPFGSIDYQSVKVDGYRENGERSTAMNFGSQDRDSLLLEAGLFADYRTGGDLTLHGALSYEAELQDDGRSISTGLNSLPGSHFKLYDIESSDDYWKLDLGLNTTFAKDVSLGINYALRQGDGGSGDQMVSVGINAGF